MYLQESSGGPTLCGIIHVPPALPGSRGKVPPAYAFRLLPGIRVRHCRRRDCFFRVHGVHGIYPKSSQASRLLGSVRASSGVSSPTFAFSTREAAGLSRFRGKVVGNQLDKEEGRRTNERARPRSGQRAPQEGRG